MTQRQSACLLWIIVLSLLWAGLLLGVSFLATPVKFMAPSLSLPVALDVGRHTFALFTKLELLLAVILLALVWVEAGSRSGALFWKLAAGALIVLVLLQIFWLRPVLDARVELIIQGTPPPASWLHNLYILYEVVKLVALLLLGSSALRKLR